MPILFIIEPNLAPAGPATILPVSAARSVETLLSNAVLLLEDAEGVAIDGRLLTIASWLRDRLEELQGELLPIVKATIETLEKHQAEARR